ncbi:MAG: hypothetical protein A2X49_12435 [Lentisphaerae bacterium GWF2_52_8]|nr:MAG: hypothetical protein A2X49_12435 [Lentisphaerae bacterium GWF2_52_8]
MVSAKDKEILRRLGEKKLKVSSLPSQKEKMELWRRLNSLQKSRPAVWMNEIPWHELEAVKPELMAQCEDQFLRQLELRLRRELYQWDHFRCDMIVDPFISCELVGGPVGSYADYGIKENARKEEGAHDVVYLPVLETLADAEQIRTPQVWYDKLETERRFICLSEIFEGIIPVIKRGLVHQWHAPWDQIIHWYGIERMYVDMYENPELVHRVIGNFTRALGEVLDMQESLGMLDLGNGNWRVGSGGMGAVDCLPEKVEGRPVSPIDQWGCSNAQIFSEVSPDMHWEFSLQYELPIMSRFGLTYYGCCEPLHKKFDMLRRIPNLRKISASPKADLEEFAMNAGHDYVISWKPNPAIYAPDFFDEVAARKQIDEAIEKCAGCSMEIIMKDVTTIRNDPERLDRWAAVAMASAESC